MKEEIIQREIQSDERQVVFVDISIPNYELLLNDLPENIEIELVYPGQDGVQVMAEWAQTHSGYQAVHILGHGSSGRQYLGQAELSSDTLEQHQTALSQVGNALSEDGDILLYGCNLGADRSGIEFINKLANVTGADIGASDDLTGVEHRGGDWVLEVESGVIESRLPLNTEVLNSTSDILLATVVDSLAAPDNTSHGEFTSSNSQWAQAILIGDVSVTLDQITIQGASASGSEAKADIYIYDDNSGLPGNPIEKLGTISTSGTTFTNLTVTSSTNPTLTANTTYWVYGEYVSDGADSLRWDASTTSTNAGTLGSVVTNGTALNGGILNGFFLDLKVEATSVPQNQPPAVDLDGDDSSGATDGNFNASFTEGDGSVAVADSDISLSDAEDDDIQTVTITLTNDQNGADEYLTSTAADNANITVSNNNTDTITLTNAGSASAADFEAVLQGIEWVNNSDDPDSANRTVTVVANDGSDGPAVTATIAVSGVNDAPTLSATGDDSSAIGAGSAVSVFSSAQIDAVESENIASVTFTVGGLTDTGNEELILDGSTVDLMTSGTRTESSGGNIAYQVTYNNGGAALILITGPAGGSAANTVFQTALNGMTYQNTLSSATTGDRTFTLSNVTDVGTGDNSWTGTVASTLSVVDGDTPTATTANYDGTEDTPVDLATVGMAATIEASNTDALDFITITGVTGGALTLTGSPSATGAAGGAGMATAGALSNGDKVSTADIALISFTPDENATTTATVTYTVTDAGGQTSAEATLTINLAAVNDAPTAADTTETVPYNGSYTFTTADFGFDDPDTGDTIQNIHIVSLPDKGTLTLGGNEVSLNLDVDPAYIDASDIANSQLVYTPEEGGVGNDYSSFTFTVGDGNSESAAPNTVTLNVAPAPSRPAPTTPPATERETVDGVDIEKQTSTDSDGNTSTTITIDPTTESREEDSSTGNSDKADIPLFRETDGNTALSVALPTGVGVTAEGSGEASRASDSLADLIRLIDETADDTAEAANKDEMLSGGESFLQTLQDENLWVNKITLTTADNTAPDAPIVISGNTQTTTSEGADNSKAALVIDATSLPADTVLQLDDVEFAVIVGPATLTGGEGQNTIFAGAGSQTIILGADDDQLYGGDGDDTVGSKGGDDLIFGENGNDTLFGGEGRDQLHGGRDTDVVTFDGDRDEYEVSQVNGVVMVTRKADSSDVDTLINVEKIQFADLTDSVEYESDLSALATLYQNALGRQADLSGFQWWAESIDNGLSLGAAAVSVLRSSESEQRIGQHFDSLSDSEQIEAFYTQLLGRASDADGKAFWLSALNNGESLEQIAEGFVTSVELKQSYIASNSWDFTV